MNIVSGSWLILSMSTVLEDAKVVDLNDDICSPGVIFIKIGLGSLESGGGGILCSGIVCNVVDDEFAMMLGGVSSFGLAMELENDVDTAIGLGFLSLCSKLAGGVVVKTNVEVSTG